MSLTQVSEFTSPTTTGNPMSATRPFDISDLPLFAIYILIAAGSCIGTLLITFIIHKIVRSIKKRDEGLTFLEEISERSEPEGSSTDCRVLGRSVRRTPEIRVDPIYANDVDIETSIYSNTNGLTEQTDTAEGKEAEDYIDMAMNPCLSTTKTQVSNLDVPLNETSTDMYVPPLKLHAAPDVSPPRKLSIEKGAQTKDLPLEEKQFVSSDGSSAAVDYSSEYENLQSTSRHVGQNSSSCQGSKKHSRELYAEVIKK